MFALDLFNTKYEKALQEGALDDTITRTQAHLMEPLSRRAAEVRAKLLQLSQIAKNLDRNDRNAWREHAMAMQALEKEYEDLVDKRMKIIKGEITSQDECMGYGGIVGEAGLPDVADKAAKMARLNQPGRAGTDTVTPQQRVNPNPNKGVVGHAVDWLRGKGGPGKEGPTYEDLDEQATPGSTAQGVYNEMIQAWTDEKDHLVIPFPNSPNATLTRPQLWNALVTLGQVAPNRRAKYIESKFNDFETFMRWLNQIKRYKVPAKKKKNVQQAMDLQPQVVAPPSVVQVAEPQVPMAETRGQKKNSEEPDLTGSTARDATVQRELQKVRARHPSARTDIEALIKDEIVNQERVDHELENLETKDNQQDAQVKQALTLNRQQEQEITNLNQELSRLDNKLNQVMSTTVAQPATQPTQTTTTTKATPATATPLAVTPATTPTTVPDTDKSAAEIARLEKQIQQLELMMTLKTPAQQDDLRDRIDALEKERDAKVEKQKASTAKGVATRKANKDKAAAAVAIEKPSTAPTTVKPEKTQKPYYPNTAGIAGMGGSTKAKPNKPTGMDFLDDLLKGHKIEMDPGETTELDPEELRQTAEVDESTDNPLDTGAGKQLSRTPEIRRLRQQKDYEMMLKKELANRIADRDAEDDEQDFQDISESTMKRLLSDLDDMSDADFLKLYKRPKQYWRNQMAAKPVASKNIMDLDSDINTARTRPTVDRTGRMVRNKSANAQQGMRRMLGKPKQTLSAPDLNPVEVTMQVPNRKTDRYDLLPARIFNSEAEAREFARKVNGHITSIKPVMHEGQWGGSGAAGLRDHYAVYTKQNGQVKRIKSTNKIGRPMNTREAEAYVAAMMRKDPAKWTHDTVWVAPADIDIDEGWKNAVASAALAGATALGAPTAHAGSVQAGALQQALKQQVLMKTQLPKPQVPQAPQPKPDDEKKEPAKEAANPAQQAAIAINMKKHHVKPKHVSEDAIPGKMVTQGFVVEYDPATQAVTISKRGQELDRFNFKGQPNLISFQRTVAKRVKDLEDDLYGADQEPGVVSLSRIKVPGRGYGYQDLSEDATENRRMAEDSIFKRILVKHRNLIREFGNDKVVQAVESVIYNIGDLGNISEGDVSTWVHQVEQILGAE